MSSTGGVARKETALDRDDLLERDTELAVIRDAITAAVQARAGGTLLLEGPAGIGKTPARRGSWAIWPGGWMSCRCCWRLRCVRARQRGRRRATAVRWCRVRARWAWRPLAS